MIGTKMCVWLMYVDKKLSKLETKVLRGNVFTSVHSLS